LIHGNFDQFFYAFGVGLIFAYIYIKTGKIKYTIALHMLVNFFGSVVPLALIKVTNIYELEKSTSLSNKLQIQKAIASLIFFLYDIIVLAVVVTGIVLLIVFRKRICISKNAPEPLPEGNKTQIMFINAGMLAFIIISAFVFAGRLCA